MSVLVAFIVSILAIAEVWYRVIRARNRDYRLSSQAINDPYRWS